MNFPIGHMFTRHAMLVKMYGEPEAAQVPQEMLSKYFDWPISTKRLEFKRRTNPSRTAALIPAIK